MTTAPLAIVTGGKRRLGAEIAAKLAGAGYALALVSQMDAPPTDALAAALDAHQSAWHAFTFDLSTGNPAELIDAIASHFGRTPDLLVNNAAMFGQDDWQAMTLETLEAHPRLVLEAPPGAGKTTQVPLALLACSWRQGRKILMLEPRRVAARSAAGVPGSLPRLSG